jgi:hypothetical protein
MSAESILENNTHKQLLLTCNFALENSIIYSQEIDEAKGLRPARYAPWRLPL